jgi:uracil phosphoribosyltransferase
VLDPMLATGGSAVAGIQTVKNWGAKEIRMLSIIAAPEGVARVREAHPDVTIYVCKIDDGLNDAAYILPGLGDAGDRIFNTVPDTGT